MDCNFFCWQQIWNLVVGEQIGWCGFVYFTCFGEQFNVKLRCYGIVVILKRDVHERKIRYCWFLKAYLIYKFITSVCDRARRRGRPGSAQHSRTREFRPIGSGPAQHCDGAWCSTGLVGFGPDTGLADFDLSGPARHSTVMELGLHADRARPSTPELLDFDRLGPAWGCPNRIISLWKIEPRHRENVCVFVMFLQIVFIDLWRFWCAVDGSRFENERWFYWWFYCRYVCMCLLVVLCFRKLILL